MAVCGEGACSRSVAKQAPVFLGALYTPAQASLLATVEGSNARLAFVHLPHTLKMMKLAAMVIGKHLRGDPPKQMWEGASPLPHFDPHSI